MTTRATVSPATPKPCAQCPWRISNQGTRHPGGWYTKANLRRLWAKLRRGENMTCHPTDPDNPLPEGWKTVPQGATTVECCGSLILQQRELMRYQALMNAHPDATPQEIKKLYRAAHPRGLTVEGLACVVQRELFGGTPLGGDAMTKPNLNEEGIGAPGVTPWVRDETR